MLNVSFLWLFLEENRPTNNLLKNSHLQQQKNHTAYCENKVRYYLKNVGYYLNYIRHYFYDMRQKKNNRFYRVAKEAKQKRK